MGITPRFTPQDIARQSQQQLQMLENGILNILHQVGMQFMKEAREDLNIDTSAFPAIRKPLPRRGKPTQTRGPGEYLDDTANLRSSIGYFVLKNGIVMYGEVEGSGEGVSAAQSLLSQVPKVQIGYQLIGVAGMDYASYLESKGFNVITSQSVVALVNLENYLKRHSARSGIGFNIESTGVQTELKITA
jgi:hypothetical protein